MPLSVINGAGIFGTAILVICVYVVERKWASFLMSFRMKSAIRGKFYIYMIYGKQNKSFIVIFLTDDFARWGDHDSRDASLNYRI